MQIATTKYSDPKQKRSDH